MVKLYDQYGKEIKSADPATSKKKQIDKKFWTLGMKLTAWLIPVAIAVASLVVTVSNWRKENAPNIAFVGMSIEGVPGKTAVRLQANYRNVGKGDALNLKSYRRVVPRNESRFPPSDLKGVRSKGKIAPGENFHSAPCDLPLEMSLALAMTEFDNDPLLYHDSFEWNDEYGKQYKYDHCLIWDRPSMNFLQCP